MSAISLNLADIRNLLVALGKERKETISTRQALEVIASGLGVSSEYLTTYTEVLGKPDEIGVALSRDHLLDLIHAVSVNNTAAMKNTQRLELLASVLHHPADAMMHKLKASEHTRVSHASLDSSANPLPALRLDDVTFEDATRWWQAIERQDGLYVVSGTTWATRSVIVPTLSQMAMDPCGADRRFQLHRLRRCPPEARFTTVEGAGKCSYSDCRQRLPDRVPL